MKNTFLLLAFVLLSFSIGCSGFPYRMKYASNLKHVLTETYGLNNVEVKLHNNSELLIIIKDEEKVALSDSDKNKLSREIGNLVAEVTRERIVLTKGEVQFMTEHDFGVAKASNAETYTLFP